MTCQASNRGNVDDPPLPLALHERCHSPATEESTLDVNGEDLVPSVLFHGLQVGVTYKASVAGIVDQNINSSEFLPDLVDHLADLSVGGNISPND